MAQQGVTKRFGSAIGGPWHGRRIASSRSSTRCSKRM